MNPFPVLLLALTPIAAIASTIVGNPTSRVVLVDGNDVYVHNVKAYRCSGGFQTLVVQETLDEWDYEKIVFDRDDFCSMTVGVKWDPEDPFIQVETVTGFDLFIADGPFNVEIELDASTQTAVLTY